MPTKERSYNKFSDRSWYPDALGKFWLVEISEYRRDLSMGISGFLMNDELLQTGRMHLFRNDLN